MLSGRKYRLELDPEQADYAESIGGICRAVWNTALEQRREYRRRGTYMNYEPQAGELAEAKREHEWLHHAPSHVLQQTLKDLHKACRDHGTFNVHWRGKGGRNRWSPSFRFPAGELILVERVGKKRGRAKLPKLGWVHFRWSRHLSGSVRSATLSRDGRHWYVSFLVEDGRTTPEQHVSTSAVGVDRGVVAAVAVSDGTMRNRKFLTPSEQQRYRRLQRQLSRRSNGSAIRRKTRATIIQIKRRERDRRKNFCLWTACQLATRHGTVVIEDLFTRNMTSSARGTIENPGSQVKQKARLNRSILDKGWHQLELALRNAARYTGCRVVKVPAAYTSQRCSQCRRVDPKNRESQAVFRCVTCGHCENADVNAARNILAAGLAVTARPLGGGTRHQHGRAPAVSAGTGVGWRLCHVPQARGPPNEMRAGPANGRTRTSEPARGHSAR
jgi:putative transposase